MSSSCDAPTRTTVLRAGSALPPTSAFRLEAMDDVPAGHPDGSRDTPAVDEGFAAGYQDGLAAAAAQAGAQAEADRAASRAHLTTALEALSRAGQDLDARTVATATELEAAIVTAAIELAEALIGRHLETAESPGTDALHRALALVPAGADVVVHVHPDDLATIDDTGIARAGGVELVADRAVERGGCLVDGDTWSIDAQLGRALARAREAIGS